MLNKCFCTWLTFFGSGRGRRGNRHRGDGDDDEDDDDGPSAVRSQQTFLDFLPDKVKSGSIHLS